MPSPSIGGMSFFSIAWRKAAPFAHSTLYRQPNRAGNSHVVGPSYGDVSTITADLFIANKLLEKTALKDMAALCGQAVTVIEVTNAGTTITHSDVFVESFKVIKSNACGGGPGGLDYIIVAEFTVYLPEDW